MVEVKLSNGSTAVIRKGKGSDLFKAQMAANNPAEVTKYLIAMLTEIDGKPVTIDTLEELPLEDVMNLMTAFGELHPLSQTASPSQPSSKKDSDTQNSKK